MFKRNLRLRKDRDFQKVYKNGGFLASDLFNLNFLLTKEPNTRIGIVISKKILKKAFQRNKLKRRIREVLKNLYPRIKPGFDVIITVKKEALAKSFAELEIELFRQLQKKELVKKDEKNIAKSDKNLPKNDLSGPRSA